MPDELDANKDGGDAAAKAAEDKVAADKAAADAAAAGDGGGDDTVTIKKSELEQIKSDRDNYKTGLLQKKADERSLDGGGKKGGPEGGDPAGGDGGGSIDESKIREIAKAESTSAFAEIHKSNESRAKRQFLKSHSEYLEDAAWTDMMSHFSSKRGKITVEDIMEDFEDAVLIHKRSTGKLDEYMKSLEDRARQQGHIQGQLDAGRDAGDGGDRNEPGKQGGLSPKGEEMARSMHTDPEKVKKVDPSKDNVITEI